LGTFDEPFSAHRYRDIQRELSHVTLAQREIAVTDRGQGIASADLPHVFTPFFRTDRSRARGTGGVGLGLTLARRIVDAHGGKIAIESRVNEGTRVTICVPLSASSAVARMTTAGS
jgi:two-component system OmpR family sensor kinase